MDHGKHMLLIGLAKPSKDKREEGSDDDEGSPENDAIEELIHQFKNGNVEGAKEAFRSAVRIFSATESQEEKDEAGY